jgi:peptide/nickel transport system permease protein
MLLRNLLRRPLPGDPARLYAGLDATAQEVAAARERFGLDRGLPEQFGHYVLNLAQGKLGRSFHSDRPVVDLLQRHFRATLNMSLIAIVLAMALGVIPRCGGARPPTSSSPWARSWGSARRRSPSASC